MRLPKGEKSENRNPAPPFSTRLYFARQLYLIPIPNQKLELEQLETVFRKTQSLIKRKFDSELESTAPLCESTFYVAEVSDGSVDDCSFAR